DINSVLRVVDKLVLELEAQLENHDVTLELTNEARQWIADRGYDPKMGARPMARVIQEHIKRPLAEVLLFGELAEGGDVLIDLKDDELVLIPTPNTKQLEHLSEPESPPGEPHE
ncbi:MAG: ATP-dependent Clp protease ATP-binding subunit ClpA, partial [Gammaproteobacteria bacterium]